MWYIQTWEKVFCKQVVTSKCGSRIEVEDRGVHLALAECTARNSTSIGFGKGMTCNRKGVHQLTYFGSNDLLIMEYVA